MSECKQEQLITARELAEALKVPVSWVYLQARTGALPFVQVGRYYRFILNDVLQHLRAGSRQGSAPQD